MKGNAWIIAIWLKVQEPRVVTVAQFFVYLFAALGGIFALQQPPPSIEATAGQGLTFYWSILLLGGGMIGMVTVLPGWWIFERAAAIACAGAALIYGLNLVLKTSNGGTSSVLSSACIILIVVLHFILRWFHIRKYSFDPERA